MSTSTYDEQPQAMNIDIGAIWRMVLRRFWLFVIPLVVFGSLSLLVAKLLPPTYLSSGLIVIEQPNVPPDLIESTVRSLAAERIELIKQRFVATDNLVSLIREHDLYSWRRETETLTQLAEEMRDDIDVNLIQQSFGRQIFTVAFRVGFKYRSPQKAKAIADVLASWYLSENARTRQERAQETKAFLAQETRAAEQEVERLENRIAEWKKQYGRRLPEQQPFMREQLDELRRQRRDIGIRLEVLETEKASLEARLESLRNAPAIGGGTGSAEAARLAEMLESLRSQRVALSTTVTEKHPDLVRLNRQIAEVEAQLEELPNTGGSTSATAGRGRDPVREEELELRVESLNRTIMAITRGQASAEADIKDLEEGLAESARISDEYQALLREHQNAVQDFNLLRRKLLDAEMGASLELSQKSERFTLVDPPQMPRSREGIPPIMVALGGIVASAGLGVMAMVGTELLDTRLRSSKKVEKLVGLEPLVVIPEITTRRERLVRWSLRIFIVLAIIGAIAGAAFYVHTRVMPLDILYIVLERKIQTQLNALGL
ncbi:Wzz/FepE/Etk N-terminal domain-containing protein [uncultured Rhodospira sp.]|uniref:GumC family protein n=1 Tax=uncultured Rhodospira sp. TaxID=1936189 RepID=UPI002605D8A6|nr:Wzz/FepE/Etk N-terminal domain-containing protein [uncultured Rhodospira sp.]